MYRSYNCAPEVLLVRSIVVNIPDEDKGGNEGEHIWNQIDTLSIPTRSSLIKPEARHGQLSFQVCCTTTQLPKMKKIKFAR